MLDVWLLPHSRGLNQDKLWCALWFFIVRKTTSEQEQAILTTLYLTGAKKHRQNCNMIMVNYAALWIVHTQVASQLKGVKLELKELKARSLLFGACTSCPMLKFDLEACSIEIKELKHKIDHSSRYHVFSLLCEMCGSF
jgi:hypothetical protein